MIGKEKIGGAHIPEDKVLNRTIKWSNKHERREFEKGYKAAINEGLIMRVKKRTGKGSDWHISLNPRKLKTIYEKAR
ncbi:MAG: hypothetical protein KJ955_02895 [Nanoarchaeota archaeon]|nr:hypothetical protein [Nanoarchaeota archaeon]